MTLTEAVEVVDLEPDTTYRRGEVEKKCKDAQISTEHLYYRAVTIPEQEGAMERMKQVKMAKVVLLASMKGNILRTPARSKAVSPMPKATSKPAAASAPGSSSTPRQRFGAHPTPARPKIPWRLAPVSFPQLLQRLLQGLGSILYVLWVLFSWPVRLLAQRKLLGATASAGAVAILLWFSFIFLTSGANGIRDGVMNCSEWLNCQLVRVITGKRAPSLPVVRVETSPSVEVWMDGQTFGSAGATAAKSIPSGDHQIEFRTNGKQLYAAALSLPAGSEALVRCTRRKTELRVNIDVTVPDASQVAGHFSSDESRNLAAINNGGHLVPSASLLMLSSCTIAPAVLAIPTPPSDFAPCAPQNASRLEIGLLGHILLFPLYVAALLCDCAILFIIKLISDIIPARPILFLDRIGGAGVDEVTDAIMVRTGHWFKRPLSRRQEYAFALLVMTISAWVLRAILAAVS